jgi:hypothetical protein
VPITGARTMSSYALENQRARRRLLRHCVLLGRALKRRVPARRRLEAAVGCEQARLLVEALTDDHGRVRRLRVKSSP